MHCRWWTTSKTRSRETLRLIGKEGGLRAAFLRVGAGMRFPAADDGTPRPAGEPETGRQLFRSSPAVPGNRMRCRGGLRMSSLHAEYRPPHGAGGVPLPGHASRRQLATVMSVPIRSGCIRELAARSGRENGRASRSMSRYLFRVAAFHADVPFLRFGCIALPLHDGMAFGGNRSFSSNINVSLQRS